MKGFFNIDRELLESSAWLSEKFTKGQAWVDLIGLARWKDGTIVIKGNYIEAKRGQLHHSQLSLSKRWKWSRNKVRKYLFELEKVQQIEQQKNNVTTCITIVNYDKYQKKVQQKDSRGTTEGQLRDSRGTTEGTQKNKVIKEQSEKGKNRTSIFKKKVIEFLENKFGYVESEKDEMAAANIKKKLQKLTGEKSNEKLLARFKLMYNNMDEFNQSNFSDLAYFERHFNKFIRNQNEAHKSKDKKPQSIKESWT